MQHTADSVVESGLGIEPTGGCVAEPLDEPVDEPTEAVGWIPLARRIEVEAQPPSLEHVGVVEEPEVIDLDPRGNDVGPTHDHLELLVVTQAEPSVDALDVRRAHSQTQTQLPAALTGLADDLDLAREGNREGGQVSEDPGLPLAGAPRAHPARPECLTVEVEATAAALETLLNLLDPGAPDGDPADPVALAALNPSPNSVCHFFTLSSKSVSS